MRTVMAMYAAALLVVGACGSTVEGIAENVIADEFGGTVDIEGDAYTVTDDTGTMQISREVPSGLSIPLLNGGTVVSAMERRAADQVSYLVELRYPVERYDHLVRFYEAYVAGLDEPVTQTTTDDSLTTTWLTDTEPRTAVEVTLDLNGVRLILGEGV